MGVSSCVSNRFTLVRKGRGGRERETDRKRGGGREGGGREKERLETRPLLKVVAFVQFSCVCVCVCRGEFICVGVPGYSSIA